MKMQLMHLKCSFSIVTYMLQACSIKIKEDTNTFFCTAVELRKVSCYSILMSIQKVL